MKKILGLTVALIAVIAMLGTGTWAYFNDINIVEDNTITAGTLKFGTATNTALSLSNKGPGDTGSSKIVDNIENAGSLNGVVRISLEGLVDKENTRESVELYSGDTTDGSTTNGELSSKLTVVFWVDRNTDGVYDAGGDSYILPNGNIVSAGALVYATLASYATTISQPITLNATTALGDLYVSYNYPTSTDKLAGGIYSAVATVPGSGYSVNDVLTILGGTGGTAKVATINGTGGVTGVTLDTAGTGYSSGIKSTSGGGGTLATVTVKASSRYNTDNVTQTDGSEIDIVLELAQQ